MSAPTRNLPQRRNPGEAERRGKGNRQDQRDNSQPPFAPHPFQALDRFLFAFAREPRLFFRERPLPLGLFHLPALLVLRPIGADDVGQGIVRQLEPFRRARHLALNDPAIDQFRDDLRGNPRFWSARPLPRSGSARRKRSAGSPR